MLVNQYFYVIRQQTFFICVCVYPFTQLRCTLSQTLMKLLLFFYEIFSPFAFHCRLQQLSHHITIVGIPMMPKYRTRNSKHGCGYGYSVMQCSVTMPAENINQNFRPVVVNIRLCKFFLCEQVIKQTNDLTEDVLHLRNHPIHLGHLRCINLLTRHIKRMLTIDASYFSRLTFV